jgi:hypothetical protein
MGSADRDAACVMAHVDQRRQSLYQLLHRIVYRNRPLTTFQHDDLCEAVEGFGMVDPTPQELAHIAKVYRERQAQAKQGPLPFRATTVTKLYGQDAYMPKRRGAQPADTVTDEEFFNIILGRNSSP